MEILSHSWSLVTGKVQGKQNWSIITSENELFALKFTMSLWIKIHEILSTKKYRKNTVGHWTKRLKKNEMEKCCHSACRVLKTYFLDTESEECKGGETKPLVKTGWSTCSSGIRITHFGKDRCLKTWMREAIYVKQEKQTQTYRGGDLMFHLSNTYTSESSRWVGDLQEWLRKITTLMSPKLLSHLSDVLYLGEDFGKYLQ